MTARCQNGCGRAVTETGKWCVDCFFDFPTGADRASEAKSSHQIREEILRAAFVLRFGTKDEQADALETLSTQITALCGA